MWTRWEARLWNPYSLFRWALTHSAMIFNVTQLSTPPAQPWRHRRALTLRLVKLTLVVVKNFAIDIISMLSALSAVKICPSLCNYPRNVTWSHLSDILSGWSSPSNSVLGKVIFHFLIFWMFDLLFCTHHKFWSQLHNIIQSRLIIVLAIFCSWFTFYMYRHTPRIGLPKNVYWSLSKPIIMHFWSDGQVCHVWKVALKFKTLRQHVAVEIFFHWGNFLPRCWMIKGNWKVPRNNDHGCKEKCLSTKHTKGRLFLLWAGIVFLRCAYFAL